MEAAKDVDLPDTSGQVDLFQQSQLINEIASFAVSIAPVTFAFTPWGRIAWGRLQYRAIVVVIEILLFLSLF